VGRQTAGQNISIVRSFYILNVNTCKSKFFQFIIKFMIGCRKPLSDYLDYNILKPLAHCELGFLCHSSYINYSPAFLQGEFFPR
jgi:hypothetical protein